MSEHNVELRVGDKTIPVTQWEMHTEWKFDPPPKKLKLNEISEVHYKVDLHGVEPGLSLFLESILGDLKGHEVHEVEGGVYQHVFTSSECFVPTTYHIMSQKAARIILKARALDRRQERWKKIKRRQKRAVFRRRKRGLA